MTCIFCDFIAGKRKYNVNGMPFKKLHETRHALAFLSTDFPATEDGHTVIIPKKHFESLEDIPNRILFALAKETKLASKILRQTHEGTNILINNGKCTGQKIPHIHFHVIPRKRNDNINLERFKRKKLSLKEFNRLHDGLKRKFDVY
ncbi:MAG: HIT domain-containing protein [Nanoarchaeota archaeon]